MPYLKKSFPYFLFLLVFLSLLSPSISTAVPDFYFHDNYISGYSPFSVPTSLSLDNSGYWEEYSPIQDNLGFVTSYNNLFMNGSSPVSAVPSYDMDLYIGKKSYIQPGEAIVIYSSSGQMSDNRIVMSSDDMFALPLGTTAPSLFDMNNIRMGDYIGSNALYNKVDNNYNLIEVPYNWNNSNLVKPFYLRGVSGYNSGSNMFMSYFLEELSPYPYSIVYLLINYGDSPSYIYWQNYMGVSTINLEGIPYNNISYDIVTSNTYVSASSSISSDSNYIYVVPHIDGNFDLYSFVHSNSSASQYYTFLSNYDVNLDFDFSTLGDVGNFSGYVSVSANFTGSANTRKVQSSFILTDLPASSGLVPIFIHQYNATRYINGKAIYIYDGYVSVQNYEELIALLKENGIGQNDLTRVIELLEEINSGGATGEQIKELMDIIENQHQQILNNLDTGQINSAFDQYKYLLDFSSSLHWIVTANNALFEYFIGFVVLCALLITIQRIMR